MPQALLFGINYPNGTCAEEIIDLLLFLETFLEVNKNLDWASGNIENVALMREEIFKTI